MAAQVTFVVEKASVDAVLQDLRTVLSGTSLLRFMEGDVTDFFRENISERFADEGDALTGFWAPLQDATVDIKRTIPDLRSDPEAVNIRTGEMFDALTKDYDTTAGPDFASLKIPGNISALAQTKIRTATQGSDNNPLGYGPTPPRPVLATSEMQLGIILEKLENHIIQFMVGSTLT